MRESQPVPCSPGEHAAPSAEGHSEAPVTDVKYALEMQLHSLGPAVEGLPEDLRRLYLQ